MPISALLSSMLGRISIVLNDCQWREIYKTYRKRYEIDPSFSFNGQGIIFYGGGKIFCGPRSYIGRHSSIQAYDGFHVYIGQGVSISHHVKIYTSNKIADSDYSLSRESASSGNVAIGDYCWIGSQVFIKENIRIGENTAIGANSVVTKNIPPHCIAAGNPARIIKIKSYVSPEEKREILKRLESQKEEYAAWK